MKEAKVKGWTAEEMKGMTGEPKGYQNPLIIALNIASNNNPLEELTRNSVLMRDYIVI